MSRLEEDQVIAQLTENCNTGFYVDIGASDGISWSNTYPLLTRGWRGLALECDPAKTPLLQSRYSGLNCDVLTEKVTPENVSRLLEAAPKCFEVLSLDIDGYDYWVLKALLETHRPRHIIVEINACVPPPYKFTVLYNPAYWWNVDTFFGMSLAAVESLLAAHGYGLHEVVADNAIFTQALERPDVCEKFRKGFLERRDGEVFPNFGQAVSARLMTLRPWEVLAEINKMWRNRLGEFAVWI